MNNITTLARPAIQALTPYQSARRIGGTGEIWLNANESPESDDFQLDCARLHRYPEFQPPELISAYARYAGVAETSVLATRGADEGIELLIRTFCEPDQDQILINPPTYGMYQISAETCGVGCIEVPLTDTFDPDISAITEKLDAVKLVFLCAPNNPTGNLLDPRELETLLQAAQGKALIVADEAYVEFCPDASQAGLLASYDNLVILRTLSKAFGLAAIRCGFTLASPTVIELLSKVIAPYPIPEPVAQIATQALSNTGLSTMRNRVESLNTRRRSFCAALDELAIVTATFPATGNFVLVKFSDANAVFAALAEQGIILRDFSRKPRLENCIRISIGSEAEMNATLHALQALSIQALSTQARSTQTRSTQASSAGGSSNE